MRPERQLRLALSHATARRARADDAWRRAIREAHEAGLSHRKIAPLAGVSHQRVAQILSE